MTKRQPLNDQMIFLFCLRKSGSEASTRLLTMRSWFQFPVLTHRGKFSKWISSEMEPTQPHEDNWIATLQNIADLNMEVDQ